MNSHLIIRLCRHTLPDGRHCQGPAIRGRACCRHHLDARTRLHNMARARRLACIPRIRVPINRRDLALNRAEVRRVINSGNVDFATARLMLWALDLTAAVLPSEPKTSARLSHNTNVYYYVPLKPLVFTKLHRKPCASSSKHKREREGGQPHARLENPTRETVGFHQSGRDVP